MNIDWNNLQLTLPGNSDRHKFDALPIFHEIYTRDCYKIETVKNILNKCDKKIVWDIGAHIGLFSLLCKINVPDCKIHTFEISPIRVEEQKKFLNNRENIKINLMQFLGFAHDEEKCKEYISKPNEDKSYLYLRGIQGVPKVSVEEYLTNSDVPDIIKIDMEGGEVGILEELNQLGLLDKVKLITGEWHFDLALNYIKDDLSRNFNVDITRRDSNDNWNHFIAINKNI